MVFYKTTYQKRRTLLKKFFGGCAALSLILTLALVGTGCADELTSEDDNVEQKSEIIPVGTKLYSYIRLLPVDGSATRDAKDQYGDDNNQYEADFEPGNPDDESKINNMLLIFFKEDGSCLSYYEVDSDSFASEEIDKPIEDDNNLSKNDDDGVVEKLGYNVLIPVEIETDEEFDAINNGCKSYFVVINYGDELFKKDQDGNISGLLVETNTASQTNTIKSLEIIKNLNLSEYRQSIGGTKQGFLMTTAGHFDSEGKYLWYDVNPDGNKVLYKSRGQALEKPLTVYVERVAARVDFSIDTKNIEPIEVLYDDTDVYELHFNPDRWGLEAEEEKTFLNKNLDVADKSKFPITNASASSYTYPADFSVWSDYYYNRVFWAKSWQFESPLSYPVKGIKDEIESGFKLKYPTYGEISGKLTRDNSDYILTGSLYTREHTFKDTELTSDKAINPYAVPTSIVLRGQYTITKANPSTDKEKPDGSPDGEAKSNLSEKALFNGFFLRYVDMERTDAPVDDEDKNKRKSYKYHIYLSDTDSKSEDAKSDELLKALISEQFMLWKKGEGEKEYVRCNYNDDKDLFEIANTFQRYDKGTEKFITASNTFTLQLKNTGTNLYYKTSGTDNYHPITTVAELKIANEALQKQLGYAQYYWEGRAFFYAPIPHYSGNADPFDTSKGGRAYDGLFNYKMNGNAYDKNPNTGNYIPNHKTGDFGVVRNHIYNFTIEKIGSLGYGIPGNDVIPLPEPRLEQELYQFDIVLKVLPWNTFQYTFDI